MISIKRLSLFITLPSLMWLALWAAINTGPWNLAGLPDGGLATINALRAAAPMAVMLVGSTYLLTANHPFLARMTLPEGLFWLYGIAMLVASFFISPWFNWGYWAFSFLAVLVVIRVYFVSGHPLLQAIQLNYLTWLIACAVLVVLVVVARDALFITETGYGVVLRADDVAGGAMSRSSGLARFAAIPAILAFVAFWRIRGLIPWVIAIAVFAISVSLIWFLQSRGALFSMFAAMAFVMIFMGKIPRIIGFVLLVFTISGGMELVPEKVRVQVAEHVTRGEGMKAFQTMSGRNRIWRNSWRAIKQQPWLGYGPQADRRIIKQNAQSGPLYAWLSAGFLGFIGYVGGILAAWWYFMRIFWEKYQLDPEQRDMLIYTGSILTFFTIRSYPENTAALYSIDMLVQLPAMVYIAMLYRFLKMERRVVREVR